MENLERLGSSVAQVEILVASLKRENRDLAGRLGQAAQERRQALDALQMELDRARAELESARQAQRQDPGLEARAHQAELEAAELSKQLEAAQREHHEATLRMDTLVRQLEAQALAGRESEQLPAANHDAALAAMQAERDQARAAFGVADEQARAAESEVRALRSRLEQALDGEAVAAQQAEAVRSRLLDREKRITSLEAAQLGLERELGEARRAAAGLPTAEEAEDLRRRVRELEGLSERAGEVQELAGRLELEKGELRRQRKELAAYAKERQALKRRVEELLATLEAVRLG
jgi:chromosome segregation ATPase